MFKILIKSAILVFIILSIYFIINPVACSNFMMGRVTRVEGQQPTDEFLLEDHSHLFVPAGDSPLQPATETAIPVGPKTEEAEKPEATAADASKTQPAYSQSEIDYAIASRYVELENEYAKQHKTGKNTAKEISYIVMDDFELTQQEWEAFLERATASNLFNKIRAEVAAGK